MNSKYFKITIISIVLLLSTFLLFFKLGHYALWDDEATTALFAQSVWKTGDSYALLGDNLIAYNSGIELHNLHNRFMPPLQFYLAAPFLGIFGNSSFAARFPFAFCGLLTILLIFTWLNKINAHKRIWIILSIGILSNVSLFLFFRQCRYFAPTILFSTLLAFFYTFRKNSIKSNFFIILSSLLLFYSNYLCAAATYACILIDYIIWGKNSYKLTKKNLFMILSSVSLFSVLFLAKYTAFEPNINTNPNFFLTLKKRFILLLWNLRELNTCEYGSGLLLLFSPFLYFFKRNKLLLRCPLAIFVYCFTLSMLSPQINEKIQLTIAVARYTVPLILLCVFTVTLSIDCLTNRSKYLYIILTIGIFGTNIFNGGALSGSYQKNFDRKGFRSTIISYINELFNPTPDPYKITSIWINNNIPRGKSIWVTPGYATYPLMFHSPDTIYAWQLKGNNTSFKDLPKIHFWRKERPDYMIAFGPYKINTINAIKEFKEIGINYIKIKQINVFWKNLSRPELYWHSFKKILNFSKKYQAIYIYKKISK